MVRCKNCRNEVKPDSHCIECGETLVLPTVGMRGKFFHPGTLGVMLPGEVLSVGQDCVKVRFDQPHSNGNHVFTVAPNFLFC